MDLHVGEDDLTTDKDLKHVGMKRMRNTVQRKAGIRILDVCCTPAVTSMHLLDSGLSRDHVRSALNPLAWSGIATKLRADYPGYRPSVQTPKVYHFFANS